MYNDFHLQAANKIADFPMAGMIPTLDDLLQSDTVCEYSNRPQEVPDSDKPQQHDRILEATVMALETGDLTPLVKEELKYTIQSRRLALGKGELEVTFDEPKTSELRPDEIEKIDRRREQNRMAAQRFRQKQKTLGSTLLKKNQKLEADNTRLRNEIDKLRTEKDQLDRALQEHLMCCPLQNLLSIT